MAANQATAEALSQVTEQLSKSGKVEAVFGEPRELKGHVIIPVADIAGGGGAGGGQGTGLKGEGEGEGSGAGLGIKTRPLGWLIVDDDQIRWRPVIDTMKIITWAGAIALIVVLMGGKGRKHGRGRKG